MNMNIDEEKFFEQLARGVKSPDMEGTLAKADNGTAKKTATAKKAEIKAEPQDEEVEAKPADDLMGEPEGQLTVDIYQTPTDIVIQSAIAGVKPEDLDIDVSTDSITIRGSRHRDQEVKDEDYFYQECYWGRFARSVILPQEIDPDNANVIFKNGVLTVRLPKLNRKRSKKLKIKFE